MLTPNSKDEKKRVELLINLQLVFKNNIPFMASDPNP